MRPVSFFQWVRDKNMTPKKLIILTDVGFACFCQQCDIMFPAGFSSTDAPTHNLTASNSSGATIWLNPRLAEVSPKPRTNTFGTPRKMLRSASVGNYDFVLGYVHP